MIKFLKNLIFPIDGVNRLSARYIVSQLKLFFYKLGIFSKHSYIDGVKIPNYKKNVVTFKILSSGFYEKNQIKIIKKHLTKDSYFFDIGTNNGFFSYYFEKKLRKNGKIYAFDAMQDLILSNNKFKNNNNLKINFEHVVFGSKNKKSQFYYNSSDVNFIHNRDLDLEQKKKIIIFKNKILKNKSENTKKIYLKTITFDDYVKKKNIKKVSFLKIDIDGSEIDFLIGALKTISKFKPFILCEIDTNLAKTKKFHYNILNKKLKDYYYIYILKNGKLIKVKKFNIKNCDGYYFFKKK